MDTAVDLTSSFAFTGVCPPAPDWQELLEQPWAKYVDLDKAYKVSVPCVQRIIDTMRPLLKGDRKYTLIDIKPQYLNAGEYPCIPGYHLDVIKDPDVERPTDHHHLVVFGSGSLTEFYLGDIPASSDGFRDLQGPSGNTREGEVVYFGKHGLHRGVKATESGPRLLIRITETDIIRPRPLSQCVSEGRIGIWRMAA